MEVAYLKLYTKANLIESVHIFFILNHVSRQMNFITYQLEIESPDAESIPVNKVVILAFMG